MKNLLSRGARLSRRTGIACVATLSLIVVSCGERPLNTMDPESPIGRKLDNFLVWLLIAAGVVFVIVQGAVIYMARRFRVDAPEDDSQVYPDDEFPEQIHGNTRLEVGWTIAPTLIMAVIAFFTMGLLFELDDVSANENQRIESVTVVGQQWWWEFQYTLTDQALEELGFDSANMPEPPHIVTANDLVLPVGEEIHLDVTSRDVIHSFWVPILNGKRDAVPGQYSPWTIEAGAEGRYAGECTEFCGLSHAYMEKFAVGIPLAEWDVWAGNQITDAEVPEEGTDAYAGWQTFSNNCASCHVVNGLTSLGSDDDVADSFAMYAVDVDNGEPPVRLIDRQTQVAGSAPNLTHVATRSSFAGGIFDMYENVDSVSYIDLASSGDLNRGALEAWIRNAPEMKANFWDSPSGPRGMTPFTALSAEEIDNLVAFLMTLD